MTESEPVIPDLGDVEKIFLDKHRLLIFSLLYLLGPKTQAELQKKTHITWGNLNSHLMALKKHGMIEVTTILTLKGPRSVVKVTPKGIAAFKRTVETLQKLLATLEQSER